LRHEIQFQGCPLYGIVDHDDVHAFTRFNNSHQKNALLLITAAVPVDCIERRERFREAPDSWP
jgi:hypothetical protein